MKKIKKEYVSYEQINLDLEILRTERSIAYHKVIKSFKDTKSEIKSSFAPINVIKSGFGLFSSSNKGTNIKAIVISALINFVIKKFINKKGA